MDTTSSSLPASAPIRIMALDVGDKRIGIALTDPLGYTVQPLMTLHAKTPRADIKSIARLIRKHGVTEAVVGKPLHMSGELSRRAQKAEAFAALLQAETGIPVHLWDERLTSWDAHQLLDEAGGKPRNASDRRSRKQIIDQVAAVLILEGFMHAREAARAPDESER
ncbi:MAG TPA: Holliday junction resolvase RuvX [Acidobacteriaceae bacterium]|jgi:putative Holliday junction resolvase|nr:Holliday junction resolvase RuvX [Acidobacteriaceae bacterium]